MALTTEPTLKGTPEVSCPRGLSVPRPTARPQRREGFTGGRHGKGRRGRGGSTHPGTQRTRDSGGPTAVLQRGGEARQLIPQTPQRGGRPLLSGPRPGTPAWEATLYVVPKWGCIRAWRLPPALPPSPPAWPPSTSSPTAASQPDARGAQGEKAAAAAPGPEVQPPARVGG